MRLITVVVTTWRRPNELRLVLEALTKQTLSRESFEIVVVDSNSGDATPDIVASFAQQSALSLKLVNAKVNSASAKRNLGMDIAAGKFVVFLDDDCVPFPSHLVDFITCAEQNPGEKIIWCGGVKFSHSLVRRSNYYRYRQSCHYASDTPRPSNLAFKAIVTMNMLIEREILVRDGLRFDESFIGYGFEDIEFGYRAEQEGYEIRTCPADIEHVEPLGNIEKFSVKYFHSARDGMPVFMMAVNDAGCWLGQSSLLEPVRADAGSFAKIAVRFLHFVLDSRLPGIACRYLSKVDSVRLLYSRSLFRFVLAGAYRKGVVDRHYGKALTIDKANKDGWYS